MQETSKYEQLNAKWHTIKAETTNGKKNENILLENNIN